MPIPWEVLLGPLGLTVVLAYIVKILWAAHEKSDADDRKERDDWKAIAISEQDGRARLIKLMEDKLDIKVPPP